MDTFGGLGKGGLERVGVFVSGLLGSGAGGLGEEGEGEWGSLAVCVVGNDFVVHMGVLTSHFTRLCRFLSFPPTLSCSRSLSHTHCSCLFVFECFPLFPFSLTFPFPVSSQPLGVFSLPDLHSVVHDGHPDKSRIVSSQLGLEPKGVGPPIKFKDCLTPP